MKTARIKNSKEEFPIGKIVCVGRNYAEHAKELGNEVPDKPVLFLKPASALIYSSEQIVHPDFSNELHHEVELVLLIGETVKNASIAGAEKVIIGYGVGLDMTLRDIQ
ncbi:MAG: fumarylacetoacetate hydrolase family protein, partial [Ignavibacteriaceae bacterium]